MRITPFFMTLLLAFGSQSALLWAASFDCSKSLTLVEKAICADAELSALDDRLAAAYRQTLTRTSDQSAIKTRQLEWLRTERNLCRDQACLRAAYLRRLQELAAAIGAPSQSSPMGGLRTLPKTHLTKTDRKAWYQKLKWPADCEETYETMSEFISNVGLEFNLLASQEYLVSVQCSLGAYQGSYVFMIYDEGKSKANILTYKCYERDEKGRLSISEETEIAGIPEFDQKEKTLTMYSKGRGIGDCGSLVKYRFEGGTSKVVEARAQPCYDDRKRMISDPKKWQKVDNP